MAYLDNTLSEKRRIPRQHLSVPIHCKLFREEESGFGWVKDFSSTGASVTTSLSFTSGDELTLSLPTVGRPEMEIAAMVRWNHGPHFGVEFKPSRERVRMSQRDHDMDRLFHLLEEIRVLLLSWDDVWRVWCYAGNVDATPPHQVG